MANAGKVRPIESFLLWVSNKLKKLPSPFQANLAKSFSKYYFYVLAIAIGTSVLSYWDVLPGIFQDEYVYSMEARKLTPAEQAYPNYLFSFLFQSTSICGGGFYQCGKALNTVFLLGTLLVFYLLARPFQTQKVSVLLTAVAALSPISVFASFFMPEMLFIFLNLLAVLLLLRASKSGDFRIWLGLGVILGLALLTKRHELFLLPGYFLASIVLVRIKGSSLLRATGTALAFTLVVPVVIRQLTVFLLTGQPFAALLGSTYAQSFRETTGSGSVEGRPAIFELLSQGFWHLLFHTAVVLVLGLAFIQWSALRRPKNQESQDSSSTQPKPLVVVTLSLVVAIIPVVTFFESYLSLVGDDHSLRLLSRYYEFIFLLLLLIASSTVNPDAISRNRRVWLWLTISAHLMFVLLIGPFIDTGPSDSPTIHGLMLIGPLLLVLLAVFVWTILPTKKVKRQRAKALTFALIIPALTVMSGFSVKADLRETLGTEYSYFDMAGFYLASEYPKLEGEDLLVIGRSRTEVVATKFAFDKPAVKHSLQPGSPKKLSAQRLDGIEIVLVLFPAALITDESVELVQELDGFRIYEVLDR